VVYVRFGLGDLVKCDIPGDREGTVTFGLSRESVAVSASRSSLFFDIPFLCLRLPLSIVSLIIILTLYA